MREEILIIWKKEDLNFSFVTISPLICTFNLASQRRVLTCFGWHWMVVLEKAALHIWCIIARFVSFVTFVSARAFFFSFLWGTATLFFIHLFLILCCLPASCLWFQSTFQLSLLLTFHPRETIIVFSVFWLYRLHYSFNYLIYTWPEYSLICVCHRPIIEFTIFYLNCNRSQSLQMYSTQTKIIFILWPFELSRRLFWPRNGLSSHHYYGRLIDLFYVSHGRNNTFMRYLILFSYTSSSSSSLSSS